MKLRFVLLRLVTISSFFPPSLFINFNQLFHPLIPNRSPFFFCVIALSPLILFLSHHICPKSLFIIKFAFLTLGSACCLSYVSSVIGLLFLLQVCLPNGNLSFISIQRDCSRISSGHKFCFSAGFSFGERAGTWRYQIRFVLPLTKLRIIYYTDVSIFVPNEKRIALFWVITHRLSVISYRRFGSTCQFYLHRSATQNTTALFWVITQ
jgi:hypothetical protein